MSYNLIVDTAGRVRELRGHHRATLRTMAQYAHKDGTGIFPSHIVLADEIGRSVKTIERHIKALIEMGYVQEERRRYNNLRSYRIVLEKIGLTVGMVEDSLKPRKKKQPPPELQIEQEEASVNEANETAYERLRELHPIDVESRIARLREKIANTQERYDSARAVGNESKAHWIKFNLEGYHQQLKDLLAEKKQKQREESHQNEYTETHARR